MRTVLITGGNRGIGLEVGRQLARAGLRVVLGARDRAAGDEAARALHDVVAGGADARAVTLDVTLDDSVAAAAAAIADQGLVVDVLVNNAGTYPPGGVLDASLEVWRSAMEVSFFGALRTSKAFVPGMIARGFGRVVNVSSGYGSFGEGLEGPAPYSVAKAALNALTKKLAEDVERPGIDVKVNACCPGWVRTRMGGAGAPRSVEQGASGIVWLATLPPDGPQGGFFRDRRPIPW